VKSAFHKPIRRLKGETGWLQDEFLRAIIAGNPRQSQLACEMAVLRLHDAWARFCRELIVLSAFGRTITLAGVPLPPSQPSIKRCHLVIPALQLISGSGYRQEPRWADAAKCIQAARHLAIANFSTVSAALGASNSPAEDIRRARNFYAHRARWTARESRETNLFVSHTRLEVFDLAAYTAGNVRIIELWVRNLNLVAMAAAQ
jgi:hypothetical protein